MDDRTRGGAACEALVGCARPQRLDDRRGEFGVLAIGLAQRVTAQRGPLHIAEGCLSGVPCFGQTAAGSTSATWLGRRRAPPNQHAPRGASRDQFPAGLVRRHDVVEGELVLFQPWREPRTVTADAAGTAS